jgi:UDP-GlcNAc:undecaprenyl-phosphate GlcNAc-1-phosphate transferase
VGPFALPAALTGGAVLGVLLWNLPPARIYFGNAGSVPLATLLAFWLVAGGTARGAEGHVRAFRSAGAAALLPLAWPLADLAFVSLSRWRRGVRPWVGGRDHTTHRLARALRSDGRAAAVLAIYALATALWAVATGPGSR